MLGPKLKFILLICFDFSQIFLFFCEASNVSLHCFPKKDLRLHQRQLQSLVFVKLPKVIIILINPIKDSITKDYILMSYCMISSKVFLFRKCKVGDSESSLPFTFSAQGSKVLFFPR